MRKLLTLKSLSLLAVAFLFSTVAFAQKKPQASPADSTSGTVAGSTIKIVYHSPSVKGRKIWGGLVPYDQIWRTGANEATIFITSKDIKIGGKTLPAGKYSLYTKPGEKEWSLIINSQTGQWGIKDEKGTTTDDPAKDVLVTTVKPMKSKSFNERMKFEITPSGFVLLWENLAVPVTIK
ncbi:MAG TPA: DUF2911 domain-containing protein [Mucilaginibacter sp.]|nr:DUF2911 domain-containing protein [Mucilaginibacter sp.]